MSSLFPVGPVFRSKEAVYCQKYIWILYRDIDHNPSLSFPMYMAGTNESFIKDISKSVKGSSKKFMKIDNPSHCQKLLQSGEKYRLIRELEAEVVPEVYS